MKKIILILAISRSLFNFTVLKRNIRLFYKYPRNFLYALTLSNEKHIKIEPYNPIAGVTARRIIKKIRNELPDQMVYFIGSSSFKINGQKDIDIMVETDKEMICMDEQKLSSLFGRPTKKRTSFIEWNLKLNGYNIELCLIFKNSKLLKERIEVHTAIANDSKLRDRYQKLKNMSNGVSVREYQFRRMEFFGTII